MPGDPGSGPEWGVAPLVVDTSAWARAHHAPVRQPWTRALLDDRLRLSSPVRLEILLSARDGAAFDRLAEQLSAVRSAPLTTGILRAAEDAMRVLAHRSAGAHRLPVVDYLVAATAQETGATVLHYDRDYDTLAEVMDLDAVWLAPPGSLP